MNRSKPFLLGAQYSFASGSYVCFHLVKLAVGKGFDSKGGKFNGMFHTALNDSINA